MRLYSCSLEDRIKTDQEFVKRLEYIKIKQTIRHPLVSSVEDFNESDFIFTIKNELFNGEPIYLSGSRINGTYITEDEFLKYSILYSNVKRSDYDIRSETDQLNKEEFERKYNVKIDYNKGTFGIKI